MLKGLFRGNGHSNGDGTQAHRDGIVATPYVPPADGGKLIVLTAPLTETIDHAGYFIQMALASLPIWMEFTINEQVSHLAQGGAQPRWDGELYAGGRAPGGEIPAEGI